jgi:hypothetical protein
MTTVISTNLYDEGKSEAAIANEFLKEFAGEYEATPGGVLGKINDLCLTLGYGYPYNEPGEVHPNPLVDIIFGLVIEGLKLHDKQQATWWSRFKRIFAKRRRGPAHCDGELVS